MSAMREVKAAIRRFSSAELDEIHEWVENVREDRLELTDEFKAKIAAASENPVEAQPANRERWLGELAELRERLATGRHEPSVDFLVAEDRGN